MFSFFLQCISGTIPNLITIFFFQYCHTRYRIAYIVKGQQISEKFQKIYGQRSFAGCFDTGVYDDVVMAGTFRQFTITLRKLETYITLGELEVYIGQKDPSNFHSQTLTQDGPRTWLVLDGPKNQNDVLDELNIRGSAHLAIQNDNSKVSIAVNKYTGDFSGTLHIGKNQLINMSMEENSVIPFSVRAYHVSIPFSSFY